MEKLLCTNPQRVFIFFCLCAFFESAVQAQPEKGFRFVDRADQKKTEVLFNGKLLTAYYYEDSIKKPVLLPINTVSGITVTRGFPVDPRPGEHVDHPHHVGLWLNYEYVNGLDFWNHSTAIPFANRIKYGTIVHEKITRAEAKGQSAVLEVKANWINQKKEVLLSELTAYKFRVVDETFFIDRTTTLTAENVDVHFNDVKDGMLGIRVTRELEHRDQEPRVFIDVDGNITTTSSVNNEGVTGEYLSSEGLKGMQVWGTRGPWMSLRGTKNQKAISITIIDHRENVGYPTYWHARGYGLFAANPLGQKVFSEGKQNLNFALKKNQSVTFRYRIVIHEDGEASSKMIEQWANEFSSRN